MSHIRTYVHICIRMYVAVHTCRYVAVTLRNVEECSRFLACGFPVCRFLACRFLTGHSSSIFHKDGVRFQPWSLIDKRVMLSGLAELEQLHVEPNSIILNTAPRTADNENWAEPGNKARYE